MGKIETIVPAKPAMQAQAVIAHLQESKRLLAALEAEVPETALAAASGEPDGRARLAALGEKIRNVTFEVECSAGARLLAAEHDQRALALWKAQILAMPVQAIVAGLTRDGCCGLCSQDTGCVVTAGVAMSDGVCAHPILEGGPQQRYRDDPQVKAIYLAACEKLNVRPRA